MRRMATALALLLGLALGPASTAFGPGVTLAQTDERCFTETGYCISGLIRTFWEQNGGLAVFGLPLGPQQQVTGDAGQPLEAQLFERQRIELHPQNPAPYNVQLGLLGIDRLTQQGRDWRAFPPLDPNNADAERCRFFAETNHQVCDAFLAAYRGAGLSLDASPEISFEESLALFGLPVSEPISETIEGKEYTVQWFQRARFELHLENQAPANVLFGRLGAEIAGSAGGDAVALQQNPWQLAFYGLNESPTPAATTQAATLTFEAERVGGSTGCNQFGGDYTANAQQINFGQIISTLIACEEPIASQERAVLSALQGLRPYSIVDGELRISYDDGRQTLIYRPASAAQAAVTGTVTYRQRSVLPPEAQIEVQLVDVSRADAPATVLVSQTIQADGKQVPFPFELRYDPAQIDERMTYAVQARITVNGALRFVSTDRYAVITQGNPTSVEVIVRPV